MLYVPVRVGVRTERERERWKFGGAKRHKRDRKRIAHISTYRMFKQCRLIPPEIRHNHVFSLRRLSNCDALILQKPVLVRLTSHYIVAGCLDNLLHFDIPWLETGESCTMLYALKSMSHPCILWDS